jgi:Zn-dependent protease
MELLSILPVLIFSIVVHEVAHAWVALREGDDTAYQLGRITLNPFAHLDLVGSFLVPLILYNVTDGMIFGWAKGFKVMRPN